MKLSSIFFRRKLSFRLVLFTMVVSVLLFNSFPVLAQPGRMIELGNFGGNSTVANDINERGQIVGSSFTQGSPQNSPVPFSGKTVS